MRLVVDPHLPGHVNMARDEQFLAEGLPTVRLYGWAPAAVSLGRAQTRDAVDVDAARALGLDVVERATGGGAIIHEASEVTYSVVLPLDHPGLPADIPGSFTYLSQGVHHALRALGLAAEFEYAGSGRATEALCYLRRQGTNILVDGRKISGGAQRRTRTTVLQHGTVIVDRDPEMYARVFRTPAADVARGVTSLGEEGVSVPRDRLVGALVAGFSDAFGARFVPTETAVLDGASPDAALQPSPSTP